MDTVSLPMRVLVKIEFGHDGGCWHWMAQRNEGGYGRVRGDGGTKSRTMQAHRYLYEHMVGPIPEGMTLDHLCGVRHCVNPAHLDPCTIGENTRRSPRTAASLNAAKTHCVRGHTLTGRNVRLDKDGNRLCRRCRADEALRRYHEKRGR